MIQELDHREKVTPKVVHIGCVTSWLVFRIYQKLAHTGGITKLHIWYIVQYDVYYGV